MTESTTDHTTETGEAKAPEQSEAAWLATGERGALWGIRLVFRVATLFGRGPARLFVGFIAAWYTIFDRPARTASRAWLTRVHGRPAKHREVFGHVRRFVNVTLDRIFLLQGRDKYFTVTRTGNENLRALTESGRGAVLLGAHLGSFEAMRIGGTDEDFPINIVGHFDNATMINTLLTELNPDIASRVIHVGRDPIGSILKMKERLEQGEMVAILGDRTGLNEKSVSARFMGANALFPTGPFLLASTLRCPVYLVFGLYFEPDRYALFCEPFAEQIVLPRKEREAALRMYVQQYAERLEHFARLAPDNWFNFFDFWSSAQDAESERESDVPTPNVTT